MAAAPVARDDSGYFTPLATAAQIQTALLSLTSIGTGNVLVEELPLDEGTSNRIFRLTFTGTKSATNVSQVSIDTTNLFEYYDAPPAVQTTVTQGGIFNETQQIVLANVTGGSWRLAFNGSVTPPLSPTATSSQIQSALNALPNIGTVSVTGNSGTFVVTFGGTTYNTNVSSIFGDAATASSGTNLRSIVTAYNAANEVTTITDPSATVSYTRDALGRATLISNTIAGLTPNVSFSQSFDGSDNRTALKATIGGINDFLTSFQYDGLNRLTDIVQQGQSGGNVVTAKHFTMGYNGLGQRTSVARYQSTGTTNPVATSDFTYDTTNRLSGIAHKQSTTNLNTYGYSYDALSRFTSITSTAEGTDTFTYDVTSQVIGATHTSHSNETYGFDLNGNRNTSGYSTGTNNQTTAGQGFTYQYDNEGNRIKRTETSTGKIQAYEWDYRNRLTRVTEKNSSAGALTKELNYSYDTFNRLIKRVIDSDGAGSVAATTQYWAYDDGINALVQFEGAAASTLSHRYVWSNKVDSLLADEQITSLGSGGNTLYPLADHLGSLRDIADFNESTGITAIANHRTYNAYGKLISESNTSVDLLFGPQENNSTKPPAYNTT